MSQNSIDYNEYDQSDVEDVINEQSTKKTQKMKELRIFTHKMKEQCWNNATVFIGRDPKRWRLDAVGNPVIKGLRGCFGPLCHEYDHITPFSKGGETTVENCQILQTQVNRQKGNKDMTRSEMKLLSKKHTFTVSQLDIIEAAVYGDIKKNNEQSINPIK